MSSTVTNTALRVTQWDSDFFEEYVRENQFTAYMGSSENSVIQVKEDLTKKPGENVVIPFVTTLSGGVSGSATLLGNEAPLNQYGFTIPVDVIRNAVAVNVFEEQVSPIDLRMAGKAMLKNWAIEKMRGGGTGSETSCDSNLGKFGMIDNLMSFYDGTTYSMYQDATEAVKDSWTANNSDRVLFGAATSNNSSNDHSASLSNIDDTADKLTSTHISLVKRLAKKASSRIRPYRAKDGREWFVYFANSVAFRNLKTDSTILQANRENWIRYSGGMGADENPIFTDGDLVWDGVIVKEVPEIPYIDNVGAGSIDVAPGFLVGAQALGLAWARRTKSVVEDTDYEFVKGIAIMDIRGTRKLYANNKQWGVFTSYTSNVE